MEKVVTPTRGPSDMKEKIFHSGTFTGNPISMIAGLATLKELEKGSVHPHINGLAVRFADGLKNLAKSLEIDIHVSRISSIFHVHFTDTPPRSKRDVLKTDLIRQRIFSIGMINNDVYLPPAHPGFFSAAHGEEEVEKMLGAAENILREIKTA
jgi:glutamate-1-semialdehyde 2,1-aminomutase